MNTVNRWKKTGKVNVDCFYGMSNNAPEGDKIKGAEILDTTGHFYCLVCEAYVRGNKKSVCRHQTRNRKHISQLIALGENPNFGMSREIKPFDMSILTGHGDPGHRLTDLSAGNLLFIHTYS